MADEKQGVEPRGIPRPKTPDQSGLITIISENLDRGVFSTDLNICCPTCENLYVFSSIETFLKLAEQLGWTYGKDGVLNKMNCCLNVDANLEIYLKLSEALGIGLPNGQVLTCCTNNFDKCVAKLSEVLTPEQISNIKAVGILEYSNLEPKGDSQLCNIIDNAIANQLTQIQTYDIILDFLNRGLVVSCDGCNTIVSSVESYLKYIGSLPNP